MFLGVVLPRDVTEFLEHLMRMTNLTVVGFKPPAGLLRATGGGGKTASEGAGSNALLGGEDPSGEEEDLYLQSVRKIPTLRKLSEGCSFFAVNLYSRSIFGKQRHMPVIRPEGERGEACRREGRTRERERERERGGVSKRGKAKLRPGCLMGVGMWFGRDFTDRDSWICHRQAEWNRNPSATSVSVDLFVVGGEPSKTRRTEK